MLFKEDCVVDAMLCGGRFVIGGGFWWVRQVHNEARNTLRAGEVERTGQGR